MQIYHYKRRDRVPNFGDELNQWLWQTLLPNCFDDEDDTVFVGIGTVLNSALPQRLGNAKRVIIFSSGAGYEAPLKLIPKDWEIDCVRGPLTAKRLCLPDHLAIADGAILLKQVWQPEFSQKAVKFAFMPHVHHAVSSSDIWQAGCDALGFRYIDPRWPVLEVLQHISSTEILITEAMHGAIAADALRVPWIPVVTSPQILQFKWQDWCASMQLPYQPQYLLPLSPSYPRFARGVRSLWRASRHWSASVSQAPQLAWCRMNQQEEHRQATLGLQKLTQVPPVLSQDTLLNLRIEQLYTTLESRVRPILTPTSQP